MKLLFVVLFLSLIATGFASFADDCVKEKYPVKLCSTIMARWKAANVPADRLFSLCKDYDDEGDADMCMDLIDSGYFEAKGKETACDDNKLMELCPTPADIAAAEKVHAEIGEGVGAKNAPPSAASPTAPGPAKKKSGGDAMAPTTLLQVNDQSMQRFRARVSNKVAACMPAQARGATPNLDNTVGTPVEVNIDWPWSNEKRDRERPYTEPPVRITVGPANTGCVLTPEADYTFCNGKGVTPNTANAASCTGANDALHTAKCGNDNVAATISNFFALPGGWLNHTYFQGKTQKAFEDGARPSSWLWAIDSCGNVKMGDEFQNRQPAAIIGDRGNRAIKHGDLIPTANGDARGPGRSGGEIKLIQNGDRRFWMINSCSSYFSLRSRRLVKYPSVRYGKTHLCAAVAHMRAYGFDTANARVIKCKDFFAQNWAHCIDCTQNPPAYTNC